MQDFISPEPIRSMFDSDQSHAVAWLQWASATPGGWQARLADKASAGQAGPDGLPVTRRAELAPADQADSGAELVKFVQAPSPCCRVSVLIDPLVSEGSRGICSTCGIVLDDAGPWWVPRPHEPGTA